MEHPQLPWLKNLSLTPSCMEHTHLSGANCKKKASRPFAQMTWPWVKSQIVPPVNLRFNPTKIGTKKMGGEFTHQPKIHPPTKMGSQNRFHHRRIPHPHPTPQNCANAIQTRPRRLSRSLAASPRTPAAQSPLSSFLKRSSGGGGELASLFGCGQKSGGPELRSGARTMAPHPAIACQLGCASKIG